MEKTKLNRRKDRIFEIIFEADTYYGKLFDILLLVVIMISVGLVMLESVPMINAKHHKLLVILEWIVTAIFTVEYGFRLYCVRKPWRYFFSFYGIIDLLSILPTYLGIIYPQTKYLSSIRILRLFRIFRIFGLTQFNRGGYTMLIALRKSRAKIVVFLAFVILIVVVIGSIMYVVEGKHPESGFTSIPISIYWAIVTLTTVGYGDIAPVTSVGKFLASVVMIIGYGVIAVPTGIVSAEAMSANLGESKRTTQVCQNCHDQNHEEAANYCKTCGNPLK
ncbi:ion transporter [Moheibacter lacus]|uniref:Ion transporter n=1 Tax=Moheibacter lacus TaxID=2745851 RepID=A0A838ZLS5_9FLAO|nr:ion transporter [Moheibacter lacus]MBA5629444.1 ion transporter [Moheibacter lacus]